MPKTIRVAEGVPLLLRDLIHERTGLFFEDHRVDYLVEKLEPVAQDRDCSSLLEYYYILKDNDIAEWNNTWNALSVQETYFWREMSQIQALTEVLIPDWFRKHPQSYRMWCAACATGEEPYSIAIALAEAGFGALPIEIVATDASQSALEKAQLGVYREKSFRAFPEHLRAKYFERRADGWAVCDTIRKKVVFERANLLDPSHVAQFARVPVIFCRNVFIYFSRHAIRQTVAMMASKMRPGGHLFVGASESLLRLTTDFELREVAGALAYVRL